VKKSFCIYCGQNPGTTRDHLPPQCFFEEPCPNINRITVPCCEPCRLADEPNDAKARNLIISTIQAEPHRVVESQLASARNRGLELHGQLPIMLQHMVQADIHTPAGIYLGSAPAFNLDSPVMDAFLHRMARGLLHSVKKSGFMPSKIKWRTNLPRDGFGIFASGISRAVGDVFSYRAVFPQESQDSLWLLTFYERLHFVVHLQSTMA
jgi:hypothetical protein